MTRVRVLVAAALFALARIAAAEIPDVRIIQGFSLMACAKQTFPDEDSPAYPLVADNTDYRANTLADYTLRFISGFATAAVVAAKGIYRQ